jgi:hypothetical protein
MSARKTEVYDFVSKFKCLQEKCPDNCCSGGWDVKVDKNALNRYKDTAPKLLDSIDKDGNMACNDDGTCKQYVNGICQIHRNYGGEILQDSCYFYPKLIRKFGKKNIAVAHLSCPGIVRLALFEDNAFAVTAQKISRTPDAMREIKLPKGINSKDADELYNTFLSFVRDSNKPVTKVMQGIINVSISLDNLKTKDWARGAQFLLSSVDQRPITFVDTQGTDPFFLIFMFIFEIRNKNERVNEIVNNICNVMKLKIDFDNKDVIYDEHSLNAYLDMREKWSKNYNQEIDGILKRYLMLEMTYNSFPFLGIGEKTSQKAISIAVKFSIIKLVLMTYMKDDGAFPSQDEIVKVIQVISKVLDHIPNPKTFLLNIEDAGWFRESRAYGLLQVFETETIKEPAILETTP